MLVTANELNSTPAAAIAREQQRLVDSIVAMPDGVRDLILSYREGEGFYQEQQEIKRIRCLINVLKYLKLNLCNSCQVPTVLQRYVHHMLDEVDVHHMDELMVFYDMFNHLKRAMNVRKRRVVHESFKWLSRVFDGEHRWDPDFAMDNHATRYMGSLWMSVRPPIIVDIDEDEEEEGEIGNAVVININ